MRRTENMINKLNKPIEIILSKDKIKLPKELEENIDKFWEETMKENPNFYDGDDILVEKMEEEENKIVLSAKMTQFSHYLYDERIGIEESDFWCSALWGGILLITNDNYFVLGEKAENTSTPLCLEDSGGSADELDVEDGKINIVKTIERELKEEMNLELNNPSQILEYKIKYLEVPEGKRHAYGILAVGKLNMTKIEMQEHYQKYLDKLTDNKEAIEFKSVKFIEIGKSRQTLENMDNPKRGYVLPLLELEEKEIM